MKIEEIDKWLDNEYGVSYTRLEELHDFVVEQDMKHQEEAEKEIERLNNIINELENIIDIEMNKMGYAKYDSCLVLIKMKIKELKGDGSNE